MAGRVNDYLTRSYSSFSGCDIRATFANVEIGTLQAISYAIQREKAPIYVLGEVNPKAFSRGKRGIAGTLIFIMFDDHAIFDAFHRAPGGTDFINFVKDKRELGPDDFSSISLDRVDPPIGLDETLNPTSPWDAWHVRQAFYVDQIPPFDITVAAMNEMGAGAVFRVYGVELLNEGYGISVDDMVSEMQTTYVARHLSRWAKAGGSQNTAPASPFDTNYVGGGTKVVETR
jgi:hypothetical protein